MCTCFISFSYIYIFLVGIISNIHKLHKYKNKLSLDYTVESEYIETNMTKFITLTNIIINTSKIIDIHIKPEKYVLYLSNNYIDGYFIFGFGHITSIDNKLEICKKNNSHDYNCLSQWIDKIKNM